MATTETKYADLGRRLRSARKRCGISQENLAATVGITRRHLIRLEFGHHLPSLPLRVAIAEATGVDAESLRVPDDDDEEGHPDVRLRRVVSELVTLGKDDLAGDLLRAMRDLRGHA